MAYYKDYGTITPDPKPVEPQQPKRRPPHPKTIMILLTGLTLSLFALLSTASCSSSSPPLAHTLNGTYQGRHLPEFSQDLFLGVPYALAPRLRRSLPLNESWAGTRDATRYTVACYADYYGFALDAVGATVGEDCLNLNIVRPAGATPDSKLPVVVWSTFPSSSSPFSPCLSLNN